MQAIELHAEIDEKGEIHLTLPVKLPAGPVRVIIFTEEATRDIQAPLLQDADAFFAELEKFPVTPRSQADIDAHIAYERENWD